MKVYGIDLGTTNSLLGYHDKLLTGLVPSIVDLGNKTAGETERQNVEAVRSFKVDMSIGSEGLQPILASSEVLKELKREAGLKGHISSIITVPADFDDSQRKATIEAATKADIDVVALINEPTAAALYVTEGRKTVAVVFDLGGGTFDVSVIDSRWGNYDVQHSAGDPRCGGDNLDEAIMKYLIKQARIQLFRLSRQEKLDLRLLATDVKIRMQKERKDFDVDLRSIGAGSVRFTEAAYIQLMKTSFMKCIMLMHRVISSSIEPGTHYEMVLVGGSTRCPYLREWIAQEIGQEPVKLTYDPDRAVAYGAALYGKMYEDGETDYMVSDVTKALSIGLADGSVQNVVPSNSKIPIEEDVMLNNPIDADTLEIKLYQGDSGIAVNNSYIGTLMYPYGRHVKAHLGSVIVTVSVGVSGTVTLSCKELGKPAVTKELTLS